MTIPPPLEDLFDDFGAELSASGTRRRRTVARRRRGAALVAVLGVGAAVAVAVVPSRAPVDVLAEARAALATGGDVLHYRVEFDEVRPPGYRPPADIVRVKRCQGPAPDVWRTTSGPLRWRVRDHAPLPCSQVRTMGARGPVTGAVDSTYADGTRTTWSRADGWALRETDVSASQARVPNLSNGFFGEASGVDPLDQLRTLVGRGDLHAAGTVEQGDRRLLRLVGPRGTAPHAPEQNVEYLVDAETYKPVRVRFDLESWRDGQTSRYEVRFPIYERLPATAENLALTSVSLPSDVNLRTVDFRKYLREMRRKRGVPEAQIRILEREEEARRVRNPLP